MRKEGLGAILAFLVAAGLGVGYLAGSSASRVSTSTTTLTLASTTTVTSQQTATSTETFVQGPPVQIGNIETATLHVGSPSYIGVNPNAGRVYIAADSSLIVMDAVTHSVVANITLPGGANAGITRAGIAVDDTSGMVFVSVQEGVAEINGSTNTVVAVLPLGLGPLAYDPSTHVIFGAPARGNGSLLGVDVRTGSVVENVSLGYRAYIMAVNPETDLVYTIGCYQLGLACVSAVSIVNGTTGSLVTTVRLNSAYYPTMAYDQATNVLYASGEGQLVALNGTNGDVILNVNPETCGPFIGMDVVAVHNQLLMVPQNYDYVLVYDGTSGALVNMYTYSSQLQSLAYNPVTSEFYLTTLSGQFLAFHDSNIIGDVDVTLIGDLQGCAPV